MSYSYEVVEVPRGQSFVYSTVASPSISCSSTVHKMKQSFSVIVPGSTYHVQWRVLVKEPVGGLINTISGRVSPPIFISKLSTEEASESSRIEEIRSEWPEIAKVIDKLKRGAKLDDADNRCIKELIEVTGWQEDDIIEELKNVDVDPSGRVKRYEELFAKYFEEALKHKKEGNTRQAAEKLWGAITALVKLYAAKKGVPIIHWSRGKMEKFITNNIDARYRKLFRGLLDKGHTMHEHFYEGHLDNRTFEERWQELIEIIEKAREIIFKSD